VIAVASIGCGRLPLPQPVPLTTDVVEHGLGAAEVGRDPRPIARTLLEDAAPDQLLLNLDRIGARALPAQEVGGRLDYCVHPPFSPCEWGRSLDRVLLRSWLTFLSWLVLRSLCSNRRRYRNRGFATFEKPASMSPLPCCTEPEGASRMAQSKRAVAKAKPTTGRSMSRTTSTPAAGRASVRMYRQGLGDCFLITLPRQDRSPWYMLIDCGVILGTQNVNDRLSEVIANLVADTGGRVDILVITHEHYDHVAAFAGLNSLFCASDQKRKDGQLQVGEVWFAWTEDPDDPLGQKLNKARAAQVNQLAAMVGRLQSSNRAMSPVTSAMVAKVGELMAFFGLGPEDLQQARAHLAGQGMAANRANGGRKHLGATAQAMENARALGGEKGERVRYWKPDETPWSSPDLPGVRIYALGPPRDEAMLKKTFATNEVYHLAASDAGHNAFFGAAALGSGDPTDEGDKWYPFDKAYGRELRDPQQGGDLRMPDATAEFLQRHYFGPGSDMGDQDQSWRRIDEDWLGNAAQFALNLDSATNNTSLVLAIELSPGGEVLLFPADAQVGNWLSWQHVNWTVDGNKTISATDLLKRTVFYKVGHHGSHNATLREHGLGADAVRSRRPAPGRSRNGGQKALEWVAGPARCAEGARRCRVAHGRRRSSGRHALPG
jgi:hypothetical protein